MLITTKFIGPTNTRGARISATFPGRKAHNSDRRDFTVTVPFNHGLRHDEAHMEAAQMLVAKWNRAALNYAASLGQSAEYASTIDGNFHCVDSTGDTCVFARVETFAVAFNAVSTAGVEADHFAKAFPNYKSAR